MKEWYSENGLKMNSNKTQCFLFESPNFNKRTETFQITIDDTVRQMEDHKFPCSSSQYFQSRTNRVCEFCPVNMLSFWK